MTIGHYLNSLEKLTRQWTPTNFRDPKRQRLYLKDIDCPEAWDHQLREYIPQTLLYLNNCVGEKGGPGSVHERDKYNHLVMGQGIAPAGDLMSNLPPDMRAENMMCYIGHEGTYTPAHREMCATVGQNIMVETSDVGKGEKPGSSIWFMTETKDREVVSEYFLSMLGHDIEVENHFAQIVAWKKAPFPVYIVEQKVGDFILIPPLAPHQVWNRGTRTIKVAWNRTTVETLEMALSEALPRARMVCRDEQYKCKAIVFYSLLRYHTDLQKAEKEEESGFGAYHSEPVRFAPRVRQLQRDFKRLFGLYKTILISEMFSPDMPKEKNVEFIPFDSNITCAYCRCNIFNRFLTCKTCVGELENGDEDTYDICMDCYAMGRSCACLSNLQWVEQWRWPELIKRYDVWRGMVLYIDGYVDNTSPQTLEIERKHSGKKPIAQICQEQLKKRPWRDITKPHVLDPLPGDSDVEPEADDEGRPKKRKATKRQSLAGKKRHSTCHICKKLEADWKLAFCTTCSLSYCYGTLWRAFDIKPEKIMETLDWQCPKCRLICSCGACRRLNSSKQIPYEPKGTLLGHDTRMVADPRSVESLVDFSRTNLAWLKGEEDTAPQDSVRMKKLLDKAHAEKSRDETLEEDSRIGEQMDIQPVGDAIDPALLSGGNEEVPTAPMFEASDLPSTIDVDANSAFVSPADLMKGPDYSVYPDPQGIPRERMMGIGYYQQRNDADKILFDAPNASADDEHQDAAYPRLQSDTEEGLLVHPNKKRQRESLKGRVDEAHLQFQAAQKKQKLSDAKREGKFFMTKNRLEGGKTCKIKLLLPGHKDFLGRLEVLGEEEAPRHNPRPGRRSLSRKEAVEVDSMVVTSDVREDVVGFEQEEPEVNTIVAVKRNQRPSIPGLEEDSTIAVTPRKPKGRPPKARVSAPVAPEPAPSNSPETQKRGPGRPRRSDAAVAEPMPENGVTTTTAAVGAQTTRRSGMFQKPAAPVASVEPPSSQKKGPGRPRKSTSLGLGEGESNKRPRSPEAEEENAEAPTRPEKKRRGSSLFVSDDSDEAAEAEGPTNSFTAVNSITIKTEPATESIAPENPPTEPTPTATEPTIPQTHLSPPANSPPKNADTPRSRPSSRDMDGGASLSPRSAPASSGASPGTLFPLDDFGDDGGAGSGGDDDDGGVFFSSRSSPSPSPSRSADIAQALPPASTSGTTSSTGNVISNGYQDAKMEALRIAEEEMAELARAKAGISKAVMSQGSASFKARFFEDEELSPSLPPAAKPVAVVAKMGLEQSRAGQGGKPVVTASALGKERGDGGGGMKVLLPAFRELPKRGLEKGTGGAAGSVTSESSDDGGDEDEEIPARRVVPTRGGTVGLGFARRGRGRGRGRGK